MVIGAGDVEDGEGEEEEGEKEEGEEEIPAPSSNGNHEKDYLVAVGVVDWLCLRRLTHLKILTNTHTHTQEGASITTALYHCTRWTCEAIMISDLIGDEKTKTKYYAT